MYQPPSLPPAGWYPDPSAPGGTRYWNGSHWEAVRDHEQLPDELPEIGEWLNASFRLGLGRWRAALFVGLIAGAASTVLFGVAIRHLLADIVITSDEVVGWSNDRLPLGITLAAIGVVCSFIGQTAISVLMLRTVDGEAPAESFGGEFGHGVRALVGAFRILPRAIGWGLVLGIATLAVLGVIVALTIVAWPLGVLAILVAIPAAIWLFVRLAFVTQSIVDRPGQPFSRSMTVADGRWWAVLGRLLLLGVIMWGISTVIQIANGIASGNVTSGFGQTTFELDDDGSFTRFEVAEAFPSSAFAILVGALAATAVAVVATTVAAAAMSILYRTRNSASDDSSPTPT